MVASHKRVAELALSDGALVAAVETGVAPAIALAVFHKGACCFDGAWGWLDPETRARPTQPDSYFDLASLTKLYTTTAFLSLVSAGAAELRTPLVEIIPEFGVIAPRAIDGGQNPHTKIQEAVDPEYAGQTVAPATVTCWHLLTHTSGLPPWRDVYTVAPPPTVSPETDAWPPTKRRNAALERLCTYPFVAPPDTGVRYSDVGLMLLDEAVARLHGTPGDLATAIRERVSELASYRPLANGVERARIAPTEYDATWRQRRVWGEVHDENACGVGGVAGHAGLFATAHDVAAFGNDWLMHTEERFGITPQVKQQATHLQAQSGADLRGLGWMLKSLSNSSAGDRFSMSSYGHTGFTGTSLWVDPDRELVVALLTNRVYHGREKPGIHTLRRAVHDAVVAAL